MSNVIAFNADGSRLTIEESHVSLEEIARVLRSVILDCERRGDHLYVVDGLDQICSLVIHSDRKQIQFVSMIEHKGPTDRVIHMVNELNGQVTMVRFHCLDDDSIWIDYFMSFDGGLNVRQLVKQLRQFAKIVAAVDADVFNAPL